MATKRLGTAMVLLLIAAAPTLLGCGSHDAFSRVIVEGSVQYDGQPVPKGAIWFVPQASMGIEAPTGFALIRDGKYKTERLKAPIAGSYSIKITGFDTVPPTAAEQAEWGDREFPGHPLFPEYVVTETISAETTTLDFEVPVSKKSKRR
ncbi:hypothetical protein AB1L30_19945 [Bremerella sp. JC817]|uniref:hypothetical protein n=1 Tax=Bremerella sp. JC817 TaxID=3231756 RepID=UPI0034591944